MKAICVDTDQAMLDQYAAMTKDVSVIESLDGFTDADQAYDWMKWHQIDIAFLDIEPEKIDGIELARKLRRLNGSIRIVFATAHEEYALEAFRVDAVGFLLKPFTREMLLHEIVKCMMVRDIPQKRVKIQTIPSFVLYVDGEPVRFERSKPEELLALLVEKADAGLTPGEAIACLWPDRESSKNSMTLLRVTFHRLMSQLKSSGIDYIVGSENRKHFIRKEQVDCDVYHILEGDVNALIPYDGEYLREYSWSESRNAQLTDMKNLYW